MSARTDAAPSAPIASILRQLAHRQPTLAAYGLLLLALTPVALLAQILDLRLIDGVDVWVKPAKFLFSISVFALTTAWFFGYVRPDRRGSVALRILAWVLIGSGSFELIYIAWQAGHDLASHFNRSTPFYNLMYGLMGINAVLLVGTTVPLAWEIARRPAPGLAQDRVAAVVIGLILCCILGGGLGAYMAQQTGHAVGPVGGAVPIFGWNRRGGDLRVAHFLGIHAQQAIPILGTALQPLPIRLRWLLLLSGAVAYAALTIVLFTQALQAIPLWPL